MAKHNDKGANETTIDPETFAAPDDAINVASQLDALDSLIKGGEFVEEQTGFYPYWTPEVRCFACEPQAGRILAEREFVCKQHNATALRGNGFCGVVLDRDDRQQSFDHDTGEVKTFTRWIVQATRLSVVCQRGARENAETVIIPPNEFFTLSDYKGLALEAFMGLEVVVKVKSKRNMPGRTPGDKPRTLWQWSANVTRDTKAMLTKQRLMMAEKARVALAEARRTNMLKPANGSAVANEHTEAAPVTR